MRKLIILLLCCGVLISMVGCGGNTAPPPTESPPITVSETITTETLPVTAVEPIEKEKETVSIESQEQAILIKVIAMRKRTSIGRRTGMFIGGVLFGLIRGIFFKNKY